MLLCGFGANNMYGPGSIPIQRASAILPKNVNMYITWSNAYAWSAHSDQPRPKK